MPEPIVVRRGLPRAPGGEPWPPGGAVAPVAPEPAAPPVAEQPVAVAEPVSGTDARVAPAAGMRRGLPRVPGGEPWPDAAPLRSSSRPRSGRIETHPAPGVPDDLETRPAAAPRSAEEQSRPAAAAAADAAAPALDGATSIRRGLPRVAGGEPWPAAAARAASPAPGATGDLETRPAAAPRSAEEPLRSSSPARSAGVETTPAKETAPGLRPATRRQWVAASVLVALAVVGAATILVAIARWFVGLEPIAAFVEQYHGTAPLPEGAPVGIPPWLSWSHFANALLIVLIIRSGLQVRAERKPEAYWTSKRTGTKASLTVWLHTSLDVLWVLNGVVFVVLLIATGQWMRIVPTTWEVVPHAISAGLQYATLDWPVEDGWVAYNALQQLAYFATVFIAAPLAIITGVRMSGWWPKGNERLDRAYPIAWARAVHFPVMLYFVVFIVTHVLLVLTTGALRNLNHMYAARDADDWIGFLWFAGSLLVIAGAWIAARPALLVPIAQRFGTVSSR
ncbi:cytochrome b/b6 domain-containing protein [Agrococcus sediminis]|uniref:cytochrome b/b6 domain-containing protein n=1 Tax=Agrococcus sediminis TaxID=2599924 RepID=UPI0034256B42